MTTLSPMTLNVTDNVTELQDTHFFDIVLSPTRFKMETVLCFFAVGCNAVILNAVCYAGSVTSRPISIYNLLFFNLVVVNILSCALSWFSNNLLYLFGRFLFNLLEYNQCMFCVVLMAGVLFSNAFSVVSALTMVGFSIVQYAVICLPFQRPTASRRRGV